MQEERLASGWAATARSQANQHKHSFTICARSLVALARRLSTKEWRRQQMSKALLARQTTIKLMYLMSEVKPPSKMNSTTAVQHYGFDQTHAKRGESRGKNSAAERV